MMPEPGLISLSRGPFFYLIDGEEFFSYVIDARTQTGPYPTTDVERTKYPEAYAAFRSASDQPSNDHSASSQPAVNPGPDDGGGIDGHAGVAALRPRKRGRPRTRPQA